MTTVAQMRAMLVGLNDESEIVIESCCGGGCVLSARAVSPYDSRRTVPIKTGWIGDYIIETCEPPPVKS